MSVTSLNSPKCWRISWRSTQATGKITLHFYWWLFLIFFTRTCKCSHTSLPSFLSHFLSLSLTHSLLRAQLREADHHQSGGGVEEEREKISALTRGRGAIRLQMRMNFDVFFGHQRTLGVDDQEKERKKCFDILDALTRSGSLDIGLPLSPSLSLSFLFICYLFISLSLSHSSSHFSLLSFLFLHASQSMPPSTSSLGRPIVLTRPWWTQVRMCGMAFAWTYSDIDPFLI